MQMLEGSRIRVYWRRRDQSAIDEANHFAAFLKENVIIGKLIPAGTGFYAYKERERIGPASNLADQGALDYAEDFDELDDYVSAGD